MTHTHIHGETPLEEGSARRKGLYLHNTQHLPPVECEPAVPASERSQAYALDRAATGIGKFIFNNGN
jgi:hypothetical protein